VIKKKEEEEEEEDEEEEEEVASRSHGHMICLFRCKPCAVPADMSDSRPT
jgi:hypothetical protein